MPELVYADGTYNPAAGGRFRVGLPSFTLQGWPVIQAPVTAVVDTLKGWWDHPPIVGGSTQRPYQDGAWLDEGFLGGRTIQVRGTFFSDSPAAVRDNWEAFLGGLSHKKLFPIAVEELGVLRHAMVRLEGDQVFDWKGLTFGRFDMQFFAPDYRKIGGAGDGPMFGETTSLPAQYGGLVFPHEYPTMIDAEVVAGLVGISNTGTAPAVVNVRITGPVVRPSIQLQDGQVMWMDLTLAANEWLDIDFTNHTILLNGQSSRRGYMRGDWLNFGPGTNTLRFDAGTTSPNATMTVTWSPAWK